MISKMETNKKKLVETLVRGRDSAKRLQNLLNWKLVNDDGLVSVDDLLANISESFYQGLLVLTPTSTHLGLACTSNQIPEGFKGKEHTSPIKERRGCYKRRYVQVLFCTTCFRHKIICTCNAYDVINLTKKTIGSRMEVSGTIEDGYAWRKYGQKEILNSKFPRCYFRCTHKHVHGCKAIKQVQKLEDESNIFEITYFGHHTCAAPNTFSHPRVVHDCKNSKNHNDLVLKQEPCDNISLSKDAQSTPPSLVWNELLMNDFESFKNDITFSDISFDDVTFS